jgi:phospholipase C
MNARSRLVALCGAAALASCSMGALPGTNAPAARSAMERGAPRRALAVPPIYGLIQHVVVIVQENRTVDNLFNGLPGADTRRNGRSGAGTVALAAEPLPFGGTLGHSHQDFVLADDSGRMDGFAKEARASQNNPYSYVPESNVVPYWQLAEQYAFGDRMFQSNSGPSFPAHQYLIAGQSNLVDDNPTHSPWGCDSPAGTLAPQLSSSGKQLAGVFPCFSYQTLADVLDARLIPWRYYAPQVNVPGGIWSAFDAIRQIRYGADWNADVITPQTRILTDVAAGELAAVTWVVPSAKASDHPGPTDGSGPDWVASVVNAIGNSPYWSTTAIVIVWDDWGGFYDHVAPRQLDEMGLGFRVPLIVVSPYAKAGYVSHVQHEFGSVLKMTEEAFALPSLGAADARADDLSDCFDFTQLPRQFRPITTHVSSADFLAQPSDGIAPDDD